MHLTNLKTKNMLAQEQLQIPDNHFSVVFRAFLSIINSVCAVLVLFMIFIVCKLLMKMYRKRLRVEKRVIIIALLTIGIIIASAYTIGVAFVCFEVRKYKQSIDFLTGYTASCVGFFVFAIIFTIFMAFRIDISRADFNFIGIFFCVGFVMAHAVLLTLFLHSEKINHLIFPLLYFHIIAVFTVCPMAVTIDINDDRRYQLVMNRSVAHLFNVTAGDFFSTL